MTNKDQFESTRQLRAAIERAIGDGPAPVPAQRHLAAGRRIVVRRRVLTAATGSAAALAIAAGAWAVVPGPGASDDQPDQGFATSPGGATADTTNNPDVVTTPAPSGSSEATEPCSLARYDKSGRIALRQGWRITERIKNPLDLAPPAQSDALALSDGTDTNWYLLAKERGSNSQACDPVPKAAGSLQEWVTQVADDEPQQVATVRFQDGTSTLEPVGDTVIIGQRPNPDVPGYAQPGDRTAAAEIEVDGKRSFVLALQIAGRGPTDVTSVNPKIVRPSTLDGFLDYAANMFESGEGMR